MKKIVIIGAGVIGAAIAREMAKYNYLVTVIEKENDVCEGSSCANSAIVHSGYDPIPNTLMAKLNVEGNKLFDKLHEELDFDFIRNGSLTIANSLEEVAILDDLLNRAIANNVEARIIGQDELRKVEPNVTKKALKALYCPSAGIVDPFLFTISLIENAMENGVNLKLNEEVIKIEKNDKSYIVYTNKASYDTDYIINAAGMKADFIANLVGISKYHLKPRKGEYFILDHFDNQFIKHTLFNVPSSKGKGILVAPTTSYNYLVGPSSEFVDDFDDVSTDFVTLNQIKEKAKDLVDYIDYSKQLKQFAGNRTVGEVHDFVIAEDLPHFINLVGIQSPGLTSAPAIALYVADLIKDKKLNPNFNPYLKKQVHLKNLNEEERNKLIKANPNYGQIICRCEQISKGEVLDAIHRTCGATSIKGIKKRTRAGFGKCQGGFCGEIVLNMLAQELHISPMAVTEAKSGSTILDHKAGASAYEDIDSLDNNGE